MIEKMQFLSITGPKDDIDRAAAETDRIIFIEDEVTTGKTIRNIISILDREYDGKFKYSVASLLNGMSEENLERYKRQGISCILRFEPLFCCLLAVSLGMAVCVDRTMFVPDLPGGCNPLFPFP